MFTSTSAAVPADLDSDDLLVETARLTRSDRGLRASGYLLRSSDDPERAYGSWYELLSDPAGELRRLTVRCDSVFGERSVSLTRAPEGPWVADGSRSHPALAGSTDVVLAGSLLTLSLPAQRLALHRAAEGTSTVADVAVIDLPELTISSEKVTYRTLSTDPNGTAEIAVTSGNGESLVVIDANGLVPRAPIASAR
jgi:hypothetical protein